MRADVVLIWQKRSEYRWACCTSVLPSQRSDGEATCVGQVIRAWLNEREWQGSVGLRIVATGSLRRVKRAVEIEARILCSQGTGGAVA